MKEYERPVITVDDSFYEGIYAASGAGSATCTKGVDGYSPSNAQCKICLGIGGNMAQGAPGASKGCPEGMPKAKGNKGNRGDKGNKKN